MFHFEVVADWIDTLLMSNMPQWLALAIEFVLIGILILSLYAVLALILILSGKFYGYYSVATYLRGYPVR